MLHKAKLCCSCLLRLLRQEALVQYASGQADKLPTCSLRQTNQADKPGRQAWAWYQELFTALGDSQPAQAQSTHTAADATGIVRDLDAELAFCGSTCA